MRVRTDDEIYRIDAVWLGPPRATFPWRATYASYALGFLIFIAVLFAQRRMGIAFNIFPTAWAVVITVFLTRVVSRKVNFEKGVFQLFEHFWHEVTGPRERTAHQRSTMRSNHVRVRRREPLRADTRRSTPRSKPAPYVRPAEAAPAQAPAGSAGRPGPAEGAAGRPPAPTQAGGRPPVPPLPSTVGRPSKRPSRRPVLRPTRGGGR